MKLYLIAPMLAANLDEVAAKVRLGDCGQRIADLIAAHLSADPALFAMRWDDETTTPPMQPNMRYGNAEVVAIRDDAMLRGVLRGNGDPYSGQWMLVRSLMTCRAVAYGHDGQAFVCLPSEADPIVSPDETLITVEDCSHLLIETDWMDGLIA